MPHPGPSQSQVRTAIGNCDHVETMAKRVQIGEDLLTSCFEQEDRGETPDWELVRGLPGRRRSYLNILIPTKMSIQISPQSVISSSV